jgi:hypothetical protein
VAVPADSRGFAETAPNKFSCQNKSDAANLRLAVKVASKLLQCGNFGGKWGDLNDISFGM